MYRVCRIIYLALLVPVFIASCGSSDTEGKAGWWREDVRLERYLGVTFEPADLGTPGTGRTARSFRAEASPYSVANCISGNDLLRKTVRGEEVVFSSTYRQGLVDEGGGLLGFAIHADFESNGFLYVNYNAENPNRTVVSRFSLREGDPLSADPDSELVLLEFNQPSANHKGGQLVFGPKDGFIFISVGDGGRPVRPHRT
jgi:glucose/arabinose dehydrogenase